MSWTLAGRPLRSILVTRLRYLGDVVMSTVVLEALRAGDPGLELGFLAEREYGSVLAGYPGLSRLHLLNARRGGTDARARGPGGGGGSAGRSRGTAGMILELRAARYDLAVDLFFNPRSAWLLKLAGIPLRIGGAQSSRRRLYTHTVVPPEPAVAWNGFDGTVSGGLGDHLARLAPLVHQPSGLPFPVWLARQYEPGELRPRLPGRSPSPAVEEVLVKMDLEPGQAFHLLAPGATWPSKEWPLEHWLELASTLAARGGSPVLVLSPPGRSERWWSLGGAIPAGRGGVLPALNLDDVLGLLSRADLLVSVDGGIMHAGVGLGVPTVGLFGPTSPEIWFPYEKCGAFRVLCTRPACHPCDLHECDEFICLPRLSPSEVLDAVDDVLGRGVEPSTG